MYQTSAKNVLQAERGDKKTIEEPADDFDRRQEHSRKLKEKRRREWNHQIEKKDNRVKIETADKNVFQTERSEKEKGAEPADDFDRRQKPSFEHQGERRRERNQLLIPQVRPAHQDPNSPLGDDSSPWGGNAVCM
jgi:hypothetical protein